MNDNEEKKERTQIDQIEEVLQGFKPNQIAEENEEEKGKEKPKDELDKKHEEEESAPETSEDSEKLELEKLREELKQTRDEISKMKQATEEEKEGEEELPPEPTTFISQEEAKDILEDPTKFATRFNEELNRVYQMGRESALREVPPVVTGSVNRTLSINEKAKEFYNENSDLLEHRQYVGYVANKLSSKYNDIDELFKETAKTVRKELGLKEKAGDLERERRKNKKPAFAKKPGGERRPEPPDDRDEQQKQIDSMIEALG